MNLFGLNRRRSQTLLLVIGQLVLVAYVFQVAAFDHWSDGTLANVAGIPGTSTHATVHDDHCHGAASTCADAGGGFAQLSPGQTMRLPSSAPSLALLADATIAELREAPLTALSEPPRRQV